MKKKPTELLRVLRFGIVGLTAAFVHCGSVIAIVEWMSIAPLLANIGGFFAAFWISYLGHYYWTFSDTKQSGQKQGTSLLRFFLVAVLGFMLNELLFFTLLQTGMRYDIALITVVLTVAIMTYLLSKLWAFRSKVFSS